MEMNSFKSLIETTNQVMQSNQEQLQESAALAVKAASRVAQPIPRIPAPPQANKPMEIGAGTKKAGMTPRTVGRLAPEASIKQKLMRGARKVGEFARAITRNPVDTLSKTAPVKAVAKLTLAKDKMTRDSGDVAASGLKGAGLDSAARVTRRATRKSPTGNIIDKGSNLLDKAKSAIADRASRPRQMSRGGDPKTYSR